MRVRDVYGILHGGPIPDCSPIRKTFVDVRDVAQLLLNAVETRNAQPRSYRYLVVGQSPVSPHAIANILRAQYPERRDTIREGNPFINPNWPSYLGQAPAFDARTARDLLGRNWIGFGQSVIDSAEVFLAAEAAEEARK
jgi:nucleoside-diphosphate-sugar epimerase